MQNAINAGIIVPTALSSSTLQRIVIKGQLRVDVTDISGYTFPAGSVIVFADASGELSVRPGRKLTIQGATVTGCNAMWNQIDVWPSGTLILENSIVRDGVSAVHVQPGATISLIGNQFRRDLVSITLGTGTLGQINYAAGGGIWGNTFAGDEGLIAPNADKRPSQGLLVLSIGSLTIGGAAQNLFKDYTNTFGNGQICVGIGIDKSNVTVNNTRFENVGRSNVGASNASIYVTSGTLNLNGLGNTGANQNTIFFDSNIQSPSAGDGIQLYASSATINNAKIDGILTGVYSFRPNGATPSTFLNVYNSNFIRFAKDAIIATTNPLSTIPLNMSSFRVINCLFDDNSLVTGTKFGVKAESGFTTSGAGFKFSNNKMYHRARPTDDNYKFYCFYLTLIEGGLGEYNELYDEGTVFFTSPNEFKGVWVSSCKKVSWASNDIIGNQIDGFNNEFAFDVADSPQCYYSCNFMDGLLYGMQFRNLCTSSGLTQNSFNRHASAGIALNETGTVIGQQLLRLNAWNANGAGKEAFMQFAGYNPFFVNDINQVQKSLFRIQTNNENTVWWANPRVVNTGGNDPNWYKGPLEGSILTYYCVEPAYPVKADLDGIEKGLLVGTYSPYRNFAANTWEAEFQLYDKLLMDTDLRPTGSLESTWYLNKYNTNIGKLVQVNKGLLNLTEPVPSGSAT